MGSLFSSPAGDRRGRRISKEMLGEGRLFTTEEVYAPCICWLVHRALKHYNANNPGAEFDYPAESATEMKAACVGFREHFIYYHLGFSASRKENQEMHRFFAELCYNIQSPNITIETCTVLENPFCRLRSSCAFCPEESKILHASESEFVCGKEAQQAEFFREGFMLLWPFQNSAIDPDLL